MLAVGQCMCEGIVSAAHTVGINANFTTFKSTYLVICWPKSNHCYTLVVY
jgi:hypothetical protein